MINIQTFITFIAEDLQEALRSVGTTSSQVARLKPSATLKVDKLTRYGTVTSGVQQMTGKPTVNLVKLVIVNLKHVIKYYSC